MEDASVSHKRNRTFKRAAKITPLTQRKHLQSEKNPTIVTKKYYWQEKKKINNELTNEKKKLLKSRRAKHSKKHNA